ncbi:Hypothetical predicted protein [Mytilus galloprovincialis]|uniref:TIR domain-containing protein n=1 Tax=Mytilus galloprovincialis TaxID=29158 RepID=A0A8B6DL06_MYTGA|nr:Hypothetical predicted protein [Mytilus galloprovincialis]
MATVIEGDEQRSVERKELPDGKKFHVFISYSESDRLWVGTVIQHLQNDYNFKCVEHSSDFIPGMKITENIEYAMSNSAKTMFILTEEYRQQYNHELSLNRVRDAVNRNRNLDLLHEEKSHFSCRGPVFRWKYVPESLSIPPMQVSSELYNDIIKTISSKHLVLVRHCRNLWWPVIYCVLTIALPSLAFGIAIWVVGNFEKDMQTMITSILYKL